MIRDYIIEQLYELGKIPYRYLFKAKRPWNISVNQLLQYSELSLGYHLGSFLLQHNFEPQPQLEDHDVFHVLTRTGITVKEEVAMQYYLLGNGKKSLFLLGTLLIGTLFYPEKIRLFIRSFRRGRKALSFHHLEFKQLLHIPITDIQSKFLIT